MVRQTRKGTGGKEPRAYFAPMNSSVVNPLQPLSKAPGTATRRKLLLQKTGAEISTGLARPGARAVVPLPAVANRKEREGCY